MIHRLLILGISALCITGCSMAEKPPADTTHISATIYPLAFLAERIGGEFVEVTQITPGGVEPHDYEPSPQQIASIHDANIFIMNGAGVDAWAETIYSDVLESGSIGINISDHLSGIDSVHNEGATSTSNSSSTKTEAIDPHFWLDPVYMQAEVMLILDALTQADPVHADAYRAQADVVLKELQQLDDAFKQGLANCNLKQIVVSHDAFGYLAKRYGFETLAISGLSPDEEPSASRIAELATIAKSDDIKYIFFETLVSPKLAQTVADEIGAQALVLNPVEGLTADDEASGADYISLMQENLQNLRTALQCQ